MMYIYIILSRREEEDNGVIIKSISCLLYGSDLIMNGKVLYLYVSFWHIRMSRNDHNRKN